MKNFAEEAELFWEDGKKRPRIVIIFYYCYQIHYMAFHHHNLTNFKLNAVKIEIAWVAWKSRVLKFGEI